MPRRPHPPHGPLGTRIVRRLTRRVTPRRARARLTLLFGVLFLATGAVLLTITYLLVDNSAGRFVSVHTGGPDQEPEVEIRPGPGPFPGLRGGLGDLARELRAQAARQHDAQMHDLLVQSGVALAIMAVISMVLGWLVAGRILRPLRTMTASIRQISAHNVHERLAVDGPADEMKQLADSVDGLLGRLERALESHKRFIANAAHELRTPLTLERALLEESLIDRDAGVDSFKANFERLLKISKQQGSLLESLLTLANSERGVDRSDPLDLADLTEEALLTLRPRAELRGVRIDGESAPAPTAGDAALVDRLIVNLVDNATYYNVPGGYVEVTTHSTAEHAVLTVSNTGPDVPPDQVDRLFEPFNRLRRTTGDGHHGLGLSIVRAIATAHDATLTAQARPDGGLIVEAAFPLRAPAPAPHRPKRPRTGTAHV
ncbi:sensor histidine kinase [Streptomyces fumanus]|uniref:sensor histidine kinase n=1 Tax=Streptomyces fumanus TaxID=67302 RepID=UPI0033CEFDDB